MTTPAPQPHFTKNCMCDKYTNCTDCQAHDTAIRNATLDSVQKLLREEAQIDENDQYYLWLEDIECAVESLRGDPIPKNNIVQFPEQP